MAEALNNVPYACLSHTPLQYLEALRVLIESNHSWSLPCLCLFIGKSRFSWTNPRQQTARAETRRSRHWKGGIWSSETVGIRLKDGQAGGEVVKAYVVWFALRSAARCVVLLPGAAQASRTSQSGSGFNASAAIQLPCWIEVGKFIFSRFQFP